MPKQVYAFIANDGSLHTGECAAATRDVELLVNGSPLAENQPFARQLVKWLTENPKQIRAVLEAHERACPRAALAAATLGAEPEGTHSSEGTRSADEIEGDMS